MPIFSKDDMDEALRGKIVTIPERQLTVGLARQLLGVAEKKDLTGIAISETGHRVPVLISIKQLRSLIANLEHAKDTAKLELALPPPSDQQTH